MQCFSSSPHGRPDLRPDGLVPVCVHLRACVCMCLCMCVHFSGERVWNFPQTLKWVWNCPPPCIMVFHGSRAPPKSSGYRSVR